MCCCQRNNVRFSCRASRDRYGRRPRFPLARRWVSRFTAEAGTIDTRLCRYIFVLVGPDDHRSVAFPLISKKSVSQSELHTFATCPTDGRVPKEDMDIPLVLRSHPTEEIRFGVGSVPGAMTKVLVQTIAHVSARLPESSYVAFCSGRCRRGISASLKGPDRNVCNSRQHAAANNTTIRRC